MRRRQAEAAAAGGRETHVCMMVQNVSLADDNRLQKEVDELVGAGYQVTVISRRDPANEPWRSVEGLELVEYPPPRDGDSTATHLREYLVSLAWQLPTLARVHLRRRIDVMQICQPPDIYFPVAWVLRKLGARVLLDQRDLMAETLQQRYNRPLTRPLKVMYWLERRAQRNVDHTVGVNGYFVERLGGAGTAPGRVSIVYNGPVLERVDRARPDPAVRGDFTHVVAWAGKMGKQDRVDQVLRLAEMVVHGQGRTDIGFVMIGNGELLDELRELSVELGLEKHVSFPGWLSEVELYGMLASTDLGVDTSLQPEVTPVKALEYMAVGIPVLSFDVRETRQLTEGAGVLVEPGDLDKMATELMKLLEDPARRAELAEVGRRRIRTELAWERQRERYLAVVADLTGRTRRARRSRSRVTGPAEPVAVRTRG